MTDRATMSENAKQAMADAWDPRNDPVLLIDQIWDAALRSAKADGWTLEPDWSDDFSKAPRDGTPVLVQYVDPQAPHELLLSVQDMNYAAGSVGLKRWKPITPPQERKE